MLWRVPSFSLSRQSCLFDGLCSLLESFPARGISTQKSKKAIRVSVCTCLHIVLLRSSLEASLCVSIWGSLNLFSSDLRDRFIPRINQQHLAMGFTSFAGRVLFSAIFIFAAWHKITDFGNNGGSSLRAMELKIGILRSHISSLGVSVPEFQLKNLLMLAIALEGLGGIFFLFGSSLGAYLLLIFLAAVTPIMHDYYNYDVSSSEYAKEFLQFLKNLSLFGGLLFFLGMKNYAAKKSQKKVVKAKAI